MLRTNRSEIIKGNNTGFFKNKNKRDLSSTTRSEQKFYKKRNKSVEINKKRSRTPNISVNKKRNRTPNASRYQNKNKLWKNQNLKKINFLKQT
jgi:hypothetical protein